MEPGGLDRCLIVVDRRKPCDDALECCTPGTTDECHELNPKRSNLCLNGVCVLGLVAGDLRPTGHVFQGICIQRDQCALCPPREAVPKAHEFAPHAVSPGVGAINGANAPVEAANVVRCEMVAAAMELLECVVASILLPEGERLVE